jgi:hypothetical protein
MPVGEKISGPKGRQPLPRATYSAALVFAASRGAALEIEIFLADARREET